MGAWGPGLYANDTAEDLKPAIAVACRLPLDGAEIIELLLDLHPEARDERDPDRTTFWLVVADQLQKRGIASDAQRRALTIIGDGSDLRSLAALGMSERDLTKRAKVLADLGDRLAAPLPIKPRTTLTKPQPLLVNPGEVFTFPVDDRGNAANPYFKDPAEAGWVPVGWGSTLILAAGHAFDHLAWYQVAPNLAPTVRRPTLDEAVAGMAPATTNDAGTLTRTHLARMGLELLGTVPLPAVDPPLPRRIISVTSSDITIANVLSLHLPAGSVASVNPG